VSVNPEKSQAVAEGSANADRSEEILQAACRIIAKSGARKLSMRDVAQEASVSKALLHYYFQSRDELLARAYEYADRRGRERVWRDVASVESGAVRLYRLFDLYLSEDENVSQDWVLWSELSSTAMFEPELRPVMDASFDRFFNWIEALVKDAVAEGSLPSEADSRATTLRLIALNDGLGSLMARGLIDRETARAILKEFLDAEFGDAGSDLGDGRGPVATGYLHLLARQMREAVDELAGLATDEAQVEAIASVSALIASRAATPVPGVKERLDARIIPPAFDLGAHRGQHRNEVPTPHLAVDIDRLEANLRLFPRALGGVSFRPHAKSHKCLPIAIRQLAAGAVGICVAKAGEARVFWSAGIRDVVIAYPVTGRDKVQEIAEMARDGRVAVHVENEVAARELSRAAETVGASIGAQIEIDTGMGRSGVPVADRSRLLGLVELVDKLPGLEYQGISTYRGLSTEPDAATAGREEAELMAQLADALRAADFPPAVVAAGSTATAAVVASVGGVTEVRAGAYPFMDGAQVAAGTVPVDRVALTVVATVVSLSGAGRVTVDAGSKTFGVGGPGCSAVYASSADGRVIIDRLNEEHGVGRLVDGGVVEVGDRIELIPTYASSAVGTTDAIVVLHRDEVREVWPVAARGGRT
jgi:D-serine deaminase-like pyridoxal phosphate-dependent protein/AcrR family transcriptional regulator